LKKEVSPALTEDRHHGRQRQQDVTQAQNNCLGSGGGSEFQHEKFSIQLASIPAAHQRLPDGPQHPRGQGRIELLVDEAPKKHFNSKGRLTRTWIFATDTIPLPLLRLLLE
jgi:hypothetical protein